MRLVIAAGSMSFSAKARQLYGVTKDELMHSAPMETSVPEATMPTPKLPAIRPKASCTGTVVLARS